MLIFKHKDGGWYGAFHKGKFKHPDTREWIEVVYYQRLAVELKGGEQLDILYARTLPDFKQNFTHYRLERFEEEADIRVTHNSFFEMRPIRKIQFEDVYEQDTN